MAAAESLGPGRSHLLGQQQPPSPTTPSAVALGHVRPLCSAGRAHGDTGAPEKAVRVLTPLLDPLPAALLTIVVDGCAAASPLPQGRNSVEQRFFC